MKLITLIAVCMMSATASYSEGVKPVKPPVEVIEPPAVHNNDGLIAAVLVVLGVAIVMSQRNEPNNPCGLTNQEYNGVKFDVEDYIINDC